MRLSISFALVIFWGSTAFARPAVEFSGYVVTAEEARFSLQEIDTKESSPWLKIGDSFHGYIVTAFDAEKQILSLKSPEGVLRLRLRGSTIKEDPSSTRSIDLERDIIGVAADGTYHLAGRTITLAELQPALARIAAMNPAPLLRIRTEAKAPFAASVSLLDEIRKSGITRISVQTDEKQP